MAGISRQNGGAPDPKATDQFQKGDGTWVLIDQMFGGGHSHSVKDPRARADGRRMNICIRDLTDWNEQLLNTEEPWDTTDYVRAGLPAVEAAYWDCSGIPRLGRACLRRVG